MTKRVAIIGAGASGLSLLRAFQWAIDKGANTDDIPEIVCFEKQPDWGGLWNYSWQTGVGDDGELVHSGMYRNLWSNTPKECIELADYSWDEHFRKAVASYAPRAAIKDYLKGRAEKSGLRKWVQFNSPVRMVTYSEESGKFTITVHDRRRDEISSGEFDYVAVATGHFSTPDIPYFEGLDTFNGRLLHSHDIRDVTEFKDKEVLLVGRGYSAEDIGSQCFKYGTKSITLSYRSRATGLKWPANWKEVPLLEKVDPNGRTCHFKDGSTKDVDAIILCTGYKHDYPFMADGLRLKTENRFWPLGLYEGVVWERNPKLFYLGMQNQVFTFNMFDAQAWFTRDVMVGRLNLPSSEEMAEHSKKWSELEKEALARGDELTMMSFQADYIKELIAQVDYPLSKEHVEQIEQVFHEWMKSKIDNVMAYRDHGYRSVFTGTMAAKCSTPWLQAWDDSLESYLEGVAA